MSDAIERLKDIIEDARTRLDERLTVIEELRARAEKAEAALAEARRERDELRGTMGSAQDKALMRGRAAHAAQERIKALEFVLRGVRGLLDTPQFAAATIDAALSPAGHDTARREAACWTCWLPSPCEKHGRAAPPPAAAPEPAAQEVGAAPCGGYRCFRAQDGSWIHSSKSYGSCRERSGEDDDAPATEQHAPAHPAPPPIAPAPTPCGDALTVRSVPPMDLVCILPAGHEGEHRSAGESMWTDAAHHPAPTPATKEET